MKVPTLRRNRGERLPGVSGTARVGRRTKGLTHRLRSGDIAVIDHVDIDRVSAEALVGCRPAAVINASPSISGRYPNLGPRIIVDAGIPLLDSVGEQVMTAVADGGQVRVDGESVYVGEQRVASGQRHTDATVAQAMADARAGVSVQLEAFAANTMEYLKREQELLLDGHGVPKLRTKLRGRHCLVVTCGYHYRADLRRLRSYLREYRPLMIGVDGGADALLEAGHTPDVVVGDMDTVSDEALKSGAEVVVHAYRDGRAPGLARVEELGIEPVLFPATGTSEDIAMLLADDNGASLIVAVGSHSTLVEFLDKGRAGMASTFLTRLRVGGKLVDARGASRLYRTRISAVPLLVLVAACLVTICVAGLISPVGRVFADWIANLVTGLLS
ncbi:MAG: putative cytokinetic ring protein SteA [Streptosporangiales bacterium]